MWQSVCPLSNAVSFVFHRESFLQSDKNDSLGPLRKAERFARAIRERYYPHRPCSIRHLPIKYVQSPDQHDKKPRQKSK